MTNSFNNDYDCISPIKNSPPYSLKKAINSERSNSLKKILHDKEKLIDLWKAKCHHLEGHFAEYSDNFEKNKKFDNLYKNNFLLKNTLDETFTNLKKTKMKNYQLENNLLKTSNKNIVKINENEIRDIIVDVDYLRKNLHKM